MTDHDYSTFVDPYCYKGTTVLKNKAGLRDASLLEVFELEMTSLRAEEPLPTGRFGPAHYCALHRHLFQDVCTWAGRYRTVRIAKGGSTFCYPEHIPTQMSALFAQMRAAVLRWQLDAPTFIQRAAGFLAELNAIHPFGDGNGRSQLSFMHSLSIKAGHPLDFARVRPRAFLGAMIKSFRGDTTSLERELSRLL